jgi:sugar phosphate isomerase/epimerase
MTLSSNDLVLCSGTLPRDVSFRERVDAAVAGGFRGVSLWGRDYERAHADGLSDADMRSLLADNELEVAEIDPAWWWLPGASDIHIPDDVDTMQIFRYGEKELFDIADAVGARSLNATDVFGGPWGIDDAAEAFAGLCDRAGNTTCSCTSRVCRGRRFPMSALRGKSFDAPVGRTGASSSTRGISFAAGPTSMRSAPYPATRC